MTTCSHCDQEMTTAISCNPFKLVFNNGSELPTEPHRDISGKRCHDCGVASGGYHHPGCDMERCPCCGRQLITCGCLFADEEQT